MSGTNGTAHDRSSAARRVRHLPKTDPDRIPPHSIEAEQAVLGAMMLEEQAVDTAVELLRVECFYATKHQDIFRAMLNLYERRSQIDIITLNDELRRIEKLEEIGGAHYLSELNLRTPTAANMQHHALLVREKWMRRALISASTATIAGCYEASADAHEQIELAEQKIFQIAETRTTRGARSMKTIAHETRMAMERQRAQGKGALSGINSGFVELNRMTGGFQRTDLVILAARPSMGKTSLAMTIARNAAVDHGIPVGFFSLEMSSEALMKRMVSAETRIDLHRVIKGDLSDEEFTRFYAALDRLQAFPLHIDDTSGLSIMDLRARARMLRRSQRIEMILVDYLQLMTAKAESREREIALIASGLKHIAKELDIPVIALSQLNRSVEHRADKKPMLSDLRESGAVEQDSDVVMFVHRPEYYGEVVDKEGNSTTGIANVIFAKHRNGPTGDVRLAFLKEHAAFGNLALMDAPATLPFDYGRSF